MKPTHPAIWKPALIVGVSLGVLGAIPFVGSCLNLCCCGLAAIAGLIAAMLYLSETEATPGVVPYGDGALVGLLSGAIGAVVLVILKAIVGLFASIVGWSLRPQIDLDELVDRGEVPPFVADLLDFVLAGGAVGIGILASLVFFVVVYSLSGAVGGIVGVAMFHGTRQGPPQEPPERAVPPPPPPAS